MAKTGKISKKVGLVTGVIILGLAVYSVFFVDWSTEPVIPKEPVRPLKTLTITNAFTATGRKYPGKVRPTQEVDLAFQVAGPLVEVAIKRGQRVPKGFLIAQIDPRDFQNNLDIANANLLEMQTKFELVKQTYEKKAATKRELIEAQARFDKATAEVKIHKKALDDTQLHAPFAGVIAERHVENYTNVQAKQRIVSLQDITQVEIEVYIPETQVLSFNRKTDDLHVTATFDYLPNRKFDVTLKEFSTDADPSTQTYRLRVIMPMPEDVNILPGMTATIQADVQKKTASKQTTQTTFAIPIDLVPVDGQGQYYVWKVIDDGQGLADVQRANVKVGEMVGNDILITQGIKQGDRIAAAGVHLLAQGRKVRLMAHVTKEQAK